MKKRNLVFHIIFIVVVVAELFSRWSDIHTLEYAAKPLILIWIGVYFFINSGKGSPRSLVLLAFLFSWIGDMFLMFAHQNEMLFYAGVGGFFIAQMLYINVFIHETKLEGGIAGHAEGDVQLMHGFLKKKPWFLILFVGYLVLMIVYLYKGLEGIMLPIIIVYGISLVAMSAAALNRKGVVSSQSFQLVFTGSVFFVISDSMIAINKFATEIPRGSFIVILTYVLAQYLIMRGLLASKIK